MTYPTGEWGKQIKHICAELDGTCEPLNNGYFRVKFPNGTTVYIPGTPSDYRGKKNTIAGWLDHPPTYQRHAEKLLDVPAHYTEPVTRRR